MTSLPVVTRFAPSPTGPLHLGHAFSALTAYQAAKASGGTFHLRLDDLDQTRSRPSWAAQLQDDLAWLGVTWDGPIWVQSERMDQYRIALQRLSTLGLLYSCTCSRADIKAAANAPQEGVPLVGPDGIVYPGTCRNVPRSEVSNENTLRLNMRKALKAADISHISFKEISGETLVKTAQDMIAQIGDVVLARRGMGASYHLAIVVDDAEQKITHVIRGEDLREATFIHVLLQKLLGWPTPMYHHHPLIRDKEGKRLAKRDDARAISTYRDIGETPNDIKKRIGLL